MNVPKGWTHVAWMVEFEIGAAELWPITDFPNPPPFGETVTPLYAPPTSEQAAVRGEGGRKQARCVAVRR